LLNIKRLDFSTDGEAVASMLTMSTLIAILTTFPVIYKLLEKKESLLGISRVRNLFEDLNILLRF